MAKVDVSVASDMNREQAWALASDLPRFDEWLRKSVQNLSRLQTAS